MRLGGMIDQAAAVARAVPEVTSMEAYVGTSAPFNFNGLVRHYFLRNRPEMGDLMVTLQPKGDRSRSSHGAGLIVAGGYGHSRLREAVFGGVTRELLRHSPCPLLLSH